MVQVTVSGLSHIGELFRNVRCVNTLDSIIVM